MKKALIVLLALLTACAKGTAEITETSAEETFTVQTIHDIQTTQIESTITSVINISAETTTQTEADKTADYTQPLSPIDITGAVDETGLITDRGIEIIDTIINNQTALYLGYYAGLFDFDRDGIPEIYLVHHNGGQGTMYVSVTTFDGNLIGNFYGYCRDGWTRLSYGEDCVYVHNFYEHSYHESFEDIEMLTYKDGVLSLDTSSEQTGYVGDAFPMKNFSYYVNAEQMMKAKYQDTQLF